MIATLDDLGTRYRLGGREKLKEEARCRMCLTPGSAAGAHRLTRHHLVPKSWLNQRSYPITIRDCDANVIPLCRHCHDGVETDVWARRMLRKVLGSVEVAFALRTAGGAWFNARYPAVDSLGPPPVPQRETPTRILKAYARLVEHPRRYRAA